MHVEMLQDMFWKMKNSITRVETTQRQNRSHVIPMDRTHTLKGHLKYFLCLGKIWGNQWGEGEKAEEGGLDHNRGRQWETASLILLLRWAACANACGINRGWWPFCFSVTHNLPRFDARIRPYFHVKTCGLSASIYC